MTNTYARIAGTGSYLPEKIVTNFDHQTTPHRRRRSINL